MLKWLIVSPIFDDVTQDCHEESREALAYIADKFEIVEDLHGRSVTRKEVEAVLLREGVNLAFWDHGSEDGLWGTPDEKIIDLQNCSILKGKEVFASACSFGKKGGVEAWKEGAKAVLCYKEVVVYTTDAKEEFCEAFNYPICRRADGFSWLDCLNKTKQKMTELIDKLVAAGKSMAAGALLWDRDNLVCYTPDNPPEEDVTDCPFRKLAIKTLGSQIGWRIPRSAGISLFLFMFGMFMLGVLGHDFIHQVWELKGTWWSIEGGYIGLIGCLLALPASYLLVIWRYMKKLKDK